MSKKKTPALQPFSFSLSSTDMLVLRITFAHLLTQIEKRYSDEDEDKQGRLLMANFLSSALEQYISNDCPIIQDKFSHTISLSNVRNEAPGQMTPKSSAKHYTKTNPPKELASRRSSRICYSVGNIVDNNEEKYEEATSTSHTDGLTNMRNQASSQTAPISSVKQINTNPPMNLPSRRSSRICYSTGKITDGDKNREEQASAAKTVSLQSSDSPTKVIALGKRNRITTNSEDLTSNLKKADRTLPSPAQKTTKSQKKQRIQEIIQKSSQDKKSKIWWRICLKQDCTKRAVNNGVCIRHGAKRRYCDLYPKCQKWAVEGGVCRQHGAKLPLCRFPGGCSNLSRQGGVCTTHGAKRKYYTKVAK